MSNIAVIGLAGAQYLVKPGDKIEVNLLDAKEGEAFSPELLFSTKGEDLLFGDGKIETKLLNHKRGEKLYVIKFKAKSRYRRRTGHRQELSVLEIVSINGEKKSAQKAESTKSTAKKVEEKLEKKSESIEVKKVTKSKTVKKSTKK